MHPATPCQISTLFDLSEESELKLYPEIIEKSEDGQADIHIVLSSQEHPRRNGQAVVTMPNKYIEYLQITIFTAHKFYAEETLSQILEHEMGHAFGLSHSNDIHSIMYPKPVIVDSSPTGRIAGCEKNELVSLYEELEIQTVSCG